MKTQDIDKEFAAYVERVKAFNAEHAVYSDTDPLQMILLTKEEFVVRKDEALAALEEMEKAE